MTTKTTDLNEAMHDVAEVKVLKAQIKNCKSAIENSFGKTEAQLDQNRATLVVLSDDFMTRKNRIMSYLKAATKEDKAKIFKAMKE